MSLEGYGIKDVTPENSLGMGTEVRAEFECERDIVHIMHGNVYIGTIFDPVLFFKNDDGSFRLRSGDAFVVVQKVVRGQ